MDAFYQVAIWQKEVEVKGSSAPYTLNELAQALKEPVFVTSLGRKSCPPSLPYRPEVIKNSSLKDACYAYTLPEELQYHLQKDELVTWRWEELTKEQSGMNHTMVYSRRDQVRSRKRWQFSKRDEYYYTEQRQKPEISQGDKNVL